MKKFILAAFILMLAFSPLLYATRGRIAGTVVDENDEPVPDVTITLRNTRYEDSILTTSTNDNGRYEYAGLPPDDFIVTAEKEGFTTITGEQKIRMGHTVTLDFVMPSLEAMRERSITPRDIAADAYNEGLELAAQGKYDQAIEQFLIAIENEEALGDDLFRAYRSMGTVFYEAGKLEEAERAFKRVVELNEEDLASRVTLGEIYNKMKDTDFDQYDHYLEKAIKEWTIAHDLSVAQNVNDANIPFNIAVLYTMIPDNEKAINWFQKTLDIDENNQEAHRQIVLQYIANPDIEDDAELKAQAIESLEAYVSRYPDDTLVPTFKEFLERWK